MSYEPRFTITPDIQDKLKKIDEALAELKRIEISPELKRLNRIRSIHATLAIEGNSLSLEEVAAIIDEMDFIDRLKKFKDYTKEMMIDYTDCIEEE